MHLELRWLEILAEDIEDPFIPTHPTWGYKLQYREISDDDQGAYLIQDWSDVLIDHSARVSDDKIND